ncbi:MULTISPECIES: DUF4123 domain-containing protein [unclassified Pseudomonas]|jgi:hypothetical protein|uniref:DUF4123 domain-containing protein n=1 Tax=unclassified Pseudomonas TaxID=196821 RepID=UPI0010203A95|nr:MULTISPECIES: DUF4123 domain-containing protein [unclassified Pseudomonas]
MNYPSNANFLLIDGVLRPDAIPSLYQLGEPLEIEPVYLGTRWTELKDLGPILVKPQGNSSVLRDWQQNHLTQADSCPLFSRASLTEIADHLRHFICPPDVNGGEGLLRFADPLVMHHWLSSYGPEHLSHVLGPVETIWIKAPVHTWCSASDAPITPFARPQSKDPRDKNFALLGEQQIAALELAYRWQFKERLYTWLNTRDAQTFSLLNSDQTEWWLEHVLDSGSAWGLVSERGLVTWAETCVDWGRDFTTRPDSPYQEWLSQNPDKGRLAPELRIEALDDYRQQALEAKDTANG